MNGFGWSKTPLKLVFILIAAVVINSALIEGIKVMLMFDPADSLDPANLSSVDSCYEGFDLIDTYVDKDESYIPFDNYFTFHLLKNAGGEKRLAVVEHHFLLPQARYREDLSTAVPEFAYNQAPVFSKDAGLMGYSCTLAPDGTIEAVSSYGESGFPVYILLIPMLIAEYIGYIFLFRKEEIA